MAEQAGQNTGEIRTEAATTQSSSGEVLGTAPAPANTQGSINNPGTPAVISGPAAVDSSGRVYTSSSVGSSGNASAVGTNTNVNIVPRSSNGTTIVTETETPAPVVVETPAPAPVIVETPAPAPVVVETPAPAPAPIVVETPAPMTSSTETVTQTRHRRLRKD